MDSWFQMASSESTPYYGWVEDSPNHHQQMKSKLVQTSAACCPTHCCTPQPVQTSASSYPPHRCTPQPVQTSPSYNPLLHCFSPQVVQISAYQKPWPNSGASQDPGPVQHAVSCQTCFPFGKLLITVIKARGIKGNGWHGLGKADPYANIKLGGRDHGIETTTSTHKSAGSNPVWNQAFPFFITRAHIEYNELSISLFNANTKFPGRKDSSLGQLRIVNVGRFVTVENANRVPEQWYPIFLDHQIRGEILLGFDFIPMPAEHILSSTDVNIPVGKYPAKGVHGNSERQANWGFTQAVAGAIQVGLGAATFAGAL